MNEKKYNEALSQARFYYGNCPTEPEKKKLENIFPELRESEDEKIRKELIFFLKEEIPQCSIKEHADKLKEFVSYLEKQKETLHISESCKENAEYFTAQCGDNRFELIDKAKRDIIAQTNIESSPDEMKVLDSFLFRAWQMGWLGKYDVIVPEQKPAWSEENEKIMDTIVSVLGQYIDYKAVSGTGSGYATPRYSKEIDWLKSLRSSWKPSESQMYALKVAIETFRVRNSDNISAGNDNVFTQIESLYEDLKKL